MTAPAVAARREVQPRDLPGLVGIPLSDEQLAAATAPLAPQLIVAGAGTGKTTVMAARVVWLIATGQVSPDQVLGLTFTNQAAAELAHRIRRAVGRLARDARGGGGDARGGGGVGFGVGESREGGEGREGGDATVLTYHAFAGRLVSAYGPLLGVESDARLVAGGQRARLAHRIACDPLDPAGLSGSPQALGEQIRAMDDTLADLDISVEELLAHDSELLALLAQARGPAALMAQMVDAAQQRRRVAALVGQFRQAKLAGEWLDFADQVRLGGLIAAGVPLAGEQLRERFRVVLLDEYQDTSRAQRRTLQALFSRGHAVTAVGDPCQAIYGWRGASVTNIDEFPRHFPVRDGAAARVDELTVNRRSRPEILAAANRISGPLRAFHAVARPLRPRPQAQAGELRCALLATWDAELLWLGNQLAELGTGRGWSQLAVLCRSNDQVAAVVDHLRNVGIPAHVSSRRDLLALPEVAAVVTLLRLLTDPYANPDVLHHLIGPRWRIGPRDLAILGRRARELAAAESADVQADTDVPVSLLDAVHDPGGDDYGYSGEARERLAAFGAELDELDALRNHPVADVVAACVETLAAGLVGVDAVTLPDSLGELIGLAQTFRGLDGSRGLADFVGYLDDCVRFEGGLGADGLAPGGASAATGPVPAANPVAGGPGPRHHHGPHDPRAELGNREGPRNGSVAVMTVHAAKGLEFGVVALPFLSDGVFPERRGRGRWVTSARAVPPVPADEPDPARTLGFPAERFTTKDHDAYVAACRFDDRLDEDRLAYVAVTRAKDVLIASGHWWGPTQTRPRGPSDYLLAIRDEVEARGAADPWVAEAGERPHEGATGGMLPPVWPAPVEVDQVARVADHLTRRISEIDREHGAGSSSESGHGSVSPDVGEPADAAGATLPPARPANHGTLESAAPGDPAVHPASWRAVVDRVIADRLRDSDEDAPVPAVVSVSSVMSWLRAPQAFAAEQRRPMPRRPTAAGAAGTAFHSWMEHRAGQQVLFELPDERATSGAARFEEMLAGTRFAERTPHVVEQPFVLSVADLVITGRIDAVFTASDATSHQGGRVFDWEVVDWKTGDPRKADPAQLAIYRTAWSQLTGCPPERIRASFVFLADGTERTYLDLVDAADVVGKLQREGPP